MVTTYAHAHTTQATLALVWNGTELVRDNGSDTEGSDSEPPLTAPEQLRAILGTCTIVAPPLPVNKEHARATAQTVFDYIASIPSERRTRAHRLALSMPLVSSTIAEWVGQHLRAHHREHTLKTALCAALNPNRTEEWMIKKSGGVTRLSHMHVVKGLALHLRMHPFTRLQVQDALSVLKHDRPRTLQQFFVKDAAVLEAAAGLVAFQRADRGAPR